MTPARLRQLEAFHALMQTGSVTRTAERLAISQPAASKLLHALEAETGLPLFNRVRRRLLPTPEAHRLHAEVERLFVSARRFDEVTHDIRALGTGELRVAALPMLGLGLLPGMLAALRARHDGLRLSLAVQSSQQVVETVLAGGADVGFVLPLMEARPLAQTAALRLPGVAVLPRAHPCARRKMLAPADFQDESFVSLGRAYRSRHLVDELFEAQGVRRRLEVETQNALSACELAAAGAGMTVVDAVTAAAVRHRAAVVPLAPTVVFRIEVVLPPVGTASVLVRELIASVRGSLGGVLVPDAATRAKAGPARL